jgi:hypothetical protein
MEHHPRNYPDPTTSLQAVSSSLSSAQLQIGTGESCLIFEQMALREKDSPASQFSRQGRCHWR